MVVFCDAIAYAGQLFPQISSWQPLDALNMGSAIRNIIRSLFNEKPVFYSYTENYPFWDYCFITGFAETSQFDKLLELSRNDNLTNKNCFALAAEGRGFHGFRNRDWITAPGNLHLSVYLSPQTAVNYFQVAFTMLSTVAAVQALDTIIALNGKAQIRWVNDIVIDQAKLGGVLTHTQTQGNRVSAAILGIGINIECTPAVKPDIFVPEVTALNAYLNDVNPQSEILHRLLEKIQINYADLLRGDSNSIFSFYKSRSMVIGRRVAVYSDPLQGKIRKFNEGKVIDIGRELELYLEGQNQPVTRGRIVIKN